jgi:hypothetical protein
VFIISRVGSSYDAEKFLDKLDKIKELDETLYCSKEKLDDMQAPFKKVEGNPQYTRSVSLHQTRVYS